MAKKSTAEDKGAGQAKAPAAAAESASGVDPALGAEGGATEGDVGGDTANSTGTVATLGDGDAAADEAAAAGAATLQAAADLATVMQSMAAAGAAERTTLYRVISPLNHDQVDHAIGAELELDEQTAKALLGHTVERVS